MLSSVTFSIIFNYSVTNIGNIDKTVDNIARMVECSRLLTNEKQTGYFHPSSLLAIIAKCGPNKTRLTEEKFMVDIKIVAENTST